MAALRQPERCDLAVVGAGIVGTMTAWLASMKHPDWTIVLIDRGLAGRGATAYSLALDITFGATHRMQQLVMRSAPIWASIRASMPDRFQTLSALAIVDAATTPARLHQFLDTERRVDDGPRFADASDLRRLRTRWPEVVLTPLDTVLAGLSATAASAMAVVDGLALRLRQRGAYCWESSEVMTVEGAPAGVELTMADGRRLLAAHVVIAVGPWMAAGHWKPIAHHVGVRIKKVVAMHLDIRPLPADPVVLFIEDDAFLLPDPAGDRYFFSFASREWDVVPDAGQLRVTADDREVAFDILRRRLPGLEGRWSGGRVFCDAYSPDRVPIIAPATADRRICVATGSSGSGFRLAPGLASTALEYLATAGLATAETVSR